MKKSILTAFLSVLALGACAESVTPEMAKAAANAWVLRNEHFGAGREAVTVRTVCDTNKAQTVLWHQVSMTGGGCVFVAPVTEIEPIMVALDSDPGELPKKHPLPAILSSDMRERLRFLGLYQEDAPAGAHLMSVAPAPVASDEQKAAAAEWAAQERAKWAELGVGSLPRLAAAPVGRTVVDSEVCIAKGFEKGGPLTHWNQEGSAGYNLYTPGKVVCGCVATAAAALVQFYGMNPSNTVMEAQSGYESETQKCSFRNVPYKEVFGEEAKTMGGTIDWSLFSGCTKATDYMRLNTDQRDIIGRVAFDCGVGVGMSWDDEGSGVTIDGCKEVATTLKEVFGFKNARFVGFRNAKKPGEDNLRKVIYGQCAAGAPVDMYIEGHAVVAVGYGQDADGTERVRVFMGWGGTGDGWYALPNIDTRATTGGASYLSRMVMGVITMISYADDDIVPVVGQLMPAIGGLEVTFNDVTDLVTDPETGTQSTAPRSMKCTDDGWFATRVPPNAGTFTISCYGKEAEYTVGTRARDSTTATQLAEDVPDWIVPFAILNSTTRYSLPGAVEAALAEDKAILRISGQSADPYTKAVLAYIFELDDANVNDFTNRYVFYFTAAGSLDGDMAPSYTVLLPRSVDSDYRWYFQNGRLSYGYARTEATAEIITTTNIVVVDEGAEIGDPGTYTNITVSATSNIVVSTYAPTGSEPVYERFPSWPEADLEAATNALRTSVLAVMNMGWEQYELRAPGNSLKVVASGGEAGEPEPGWGLHADCYRNGETITATAAGELTNEVDGVIMGCSGWKLYNERTGVELSGNGNSVDIAFTENDEYVLTWQVVTNYVKVTVNMFPDRMARVGASVTPGTGWYPYGQYTTFTANAPEGYTLESWNGSGAAGLPEDAYRSNTSVSFAPVAPISITARFATGGASDEDPEVTTYTLTTISYGITEEGIEELSGAIPASAVQGGGEASGSTLADGGSVELNTSPVIITPESTTFTDADEQRWKHSYWMLFSGEVTREAIESGTAMSQYITANYHDAAAAFRLRQNATLVRFYEPDNSEEPTPEEVELTIKWNETMDNLKPGENVLLTAEQAAALPEGSQVTVVEDVPAGWKLDGVETREDGSVVATLSLDEDALTPLPPEGQSSPLTIVNNPDGTVTVEATIANGVRGFWYSLYTAPVLSGEWKVVASGEYESGTPSTQMAEAEGEVKLSIVVNPAEASRFYKLVVSSSAPSES